MTLPDQILAILGRGPATNTQLADRMGVESWQVTAALDDLKRRGKVRREAVAGKRQGLWHLGSKVGLNTPPLSAPETAISLPPYRDEPETPPPLRQGSCDFCGGPVGARLKYCSDPCRIAMDRFLRAFGRKIAPWVLLARTRRTKRKGADRDAVATEALRHLRDDADRALQRLNDARREAEG